MRTGDAAIGVPETIALSLRGTTRLFRGRLGVLGFHARTAICYGVIFACGSSIRAIADVSRVSGGYDYGPLALVSGWTLLVVAVVAMAIILVNLMRRLNDLDRSRWWILLSLIPPVNIFLHLWLYFWPGSKQVNRFGGPPFPDQFERMIGRIGLCGMLVMLIVGMWRLESQSPFDRQREKVNAHDATLARFAANESRAVPILSEAMFRQGIVGQAAVFVGSDVDAPMVFEADGTLLGSFNQQGGRQDDSDLLWRWHDGKLCREGRIARVRIPRACGSASLVPDAGLMVEYEGSASSERWVLDVRALEQAMSLLQ